jgi:hypothetical protein
MLVYPQLPSGALTQFPVQRRHQVRTLLNTAADGTVVKLADPGAETVQWQLKYSALTDAELAALLQFFTAAEGSLNNFTFVDPTANLLAWSTDLTNAVWDAGPFLSLAGAIADPLGGNGAWQVVNSGAAVQDFTQTLTAPGVYVYCVSVYAKSTAPAAFTLLLGGNRYNQNLAAEWQRFSCTGTSDPTASSVTFGIELGAGAAVDIYGLQVEPQPNPSLYKPSTTGGCYENARLGDDTLSFTTTDVNHHSATVNILYASNL